jgi:ankyrin repeat protein
MKYIKTFEAKKDDINLELMDAIYFNNISDTIENILKRGADINFKNDHNRTPLMVAIARERNKIARYLVKNGADINHQDNEGVTPLMLAGKMNSFEMLQLLIEAGADWNLKNNNKKDFFNYLMENKEKMIIEDYPEQYKEYLIKKDADKYNL